MKTRTCVLRGFFCCAVLLMLFARDAQAQGSMSASPSSIAFGNQAAGTTAAPVAVTLTNNDPTNTFTVQNIFSTSGPFSVSGPALPLALAPLQSMTVNVTFTPSGTGPVSGLFGFTTYHGFRISVPLSGAGISGSGPLLSANPATLNFGMASAGAPSLETTNLYNAGTASIAVTSLLFSDPGITVVGMYPGLVLAPGQTATMAALFAPGSDGVTAGTITIGSTASNSPLVLNWSVAQAGGIGAPAVAPTGPPPVDLSWNASTSADVIGYNVYRGLISGGPYFLLTPVPVAATNYVDASVSSSQTFFYVVTSVDAWGDESAYSSEVSATIP
jgi:hypothetical protein